MINGTLLNKVLTAMTKALTANVSDKDIVTVAVGTDTLTITSSLMSVSITMAGMIGNEQHEFCLSCSQFKQAIRGIKTITLDLSDDKNMLLIGDTTKTVSAILIGSTATAFPTIDGMTNHHEYLVNSIRFHRSWSLACSTISIPSKKYTFNEGLCTMLIEHDGVDVRLVSADYHRLTIATGFTEKDFNNVKPIEETSEEPVSALALNIPYQSCSFINELLKVDRKNVLMSVRMQTVDGIDYMQIESGDITCTVKGITVNRFPQYKQVIPRDGLVATISFSDSSFSDSILQPIKQLWDNRPALTHDKTGKQKKTDMRLTFDLSRSRSIIRITNKRDSSREISPALDASSFLRFESGDNALFILNYSYLVTLLEASKDTTLTMEYRDRSNVLMFQDGQGNTTLIMPVY